MVTLFSTAKPFTGHTAVIQQNALQSWKLLHPEAEVILFGDEDGAAKVCRDFGLRHEPDVLRTPNGTKRLDFIFGRAQQIARHDVLVYANCDIILCHEFVQALQRLLAWRQKFLMVGCRWDTNITEPLDFSRPDWENEILARAKTTGIRRFYHAIDYFLFQRGLYPVIPPLVIGRIWWDHWLVGKIHDAGVPVVDVSDVVCAVHQNHDYGYHPQGMTGVWQDEEAQRNYALASRETRLRTIEDATFGLTAAGIVPNRFYWLAPAKRKWRKVSKAVRGTMRTRVWHPLLDATRPARRAVGLDKDAVPNALRDRKRQHEMDQ